MNILLAKNITFDQSKTIGKAGLTYFRLGKTLEKLTKTI